MDGKFNNRKSGLGLKATLALGVGMGAMFVGMATGSAIAQDADGDDTALRQNAIIVTATKRATTLQDTPVAVSVIGGGDIKNSQIRDIKDLSLLAPSLATPQAASSAQTVFRIRGIGTSGFNAGLEPSVGVFVDGVYRSRQGASIGDFPTIERIEVLRGPQSTLYGKNTPAGVISFITKKPQYEFGYDLEATIGNYDSKIIKGSFTGPLADSVAFRVSGSLNRRDGFIKNITTGERVNDRDRSALRGQLLFDPSDNVQIRLIADYSTLNEACCAAPAYVHNPTNLFVLGTALGGNLLPARPFDRKVAFDGALLTDSQSWGLSAQMDIDLGWADLTSITAHRDYENTNDIDADFVDLNLSGINQNMEDYTTFTQEVRLSSNGDGRIQWLGGAYYFNQDLNHDRVSTFGSVLRPFADLVTGPLVGGPAGGGVSTLEGILGLFPGGPAPGSFLGAGFGLQQELFNQNDESFAVFGNADFELTDQVTLSGGIRWATETKEVRSGVVIDDPFQSLDLTNVPQLAAVPLPLNTFAFLGAFQFFPAFTNFQDKRTEDNFSYMGRIAYEPIDALSFYASYTTGWKAGGFNLAVSSTPTSRTFRDETTQSIEIGAKGSFMDGRVTVNAAAFDQSVDDFQANSFDGRAFTLNNAGKKSLQGFEIDSILAPFENLIITGAVAYLDDEFDSFVGGPCLNSAFITAAIEQQFLTCARVLPSTGLPNPAFTGVQDLSGQKDLVSSKWSGSSTATLRVPMGNLEGFLRGEVQFRSGFSTSNDGTPGKAVDSFQLFNTSFGVTNPDAGWDFVVWGKNIFDEDTSQGIFDSVAQAGSLNGYPGDPATYGVTLRLSR